MSIRKQFGAKLRRVRRSQDLTQAALAARSGLHINYISGIERGTRNPSLIAVGQLATALGLKLHELVNFEE